MPRAHRDLPPELTSRPFAIEEGRAAGLSRARLSEADLGVPFNSVRIAGEPSDARDLVAAFALRSPPDHVVSHTTALLLWGAPLPRAVEHQTRIHVASSDGVTPRARRTIGHTLDPARAGIAQLDGLALTDPATSWVLSAPLLGLDDLVAAGDFLVTGTRPFDGDPPLVTRDELTNAIWLHAGARGIRRAREALALVRYGSLSRQETFARLMLTRAGLPEPQLNHRVRSPRGLEVAMVDLAYPDQRIAIEFESLLHLSPQKFRRDIRKQQDLAAIDWATHRLTATDVDPRLADPSSRAAVSRIRTTLIQRGWRETAHRTPKRPV